MTALERSLSQADDDLETITSILNHDARSPLVSVMGFLAELRLLHAETLEHWPRSDENAKERDRLACETREAFAYLDEGAKRMAHVLQVLGELGSYRRQVLLVESIDTPALFAEAAAAVPGLELEVGALPSVDTDRGALLAVIGHLLDNAARYRRPEEGPRVRVSAEVLEDRIALRITDNGRGIAAGDLARIFRPFIRLAPLAGEGQGLGLAYSRGLARRLGGDLRAESVVGESTTLLLDLPRTAPAKYPRHRS